jgi:DNA-directed RNA polymerase beta subunit
MPCHGNSRMTIAHLIETLMGKFGLLVGTEGDATPFTEVTVAEISSRLHHVSAPSCTCKKLCAPALVL